MKIEIKGVIVPSDDQWIYDFFDIAAVSPAAVNKALEQAGGQLVDVEINSGGGDVFSGSEIYTALRGYSGGVRIKIVGFAGSAASVIAMAGQSEISPTAQMMVHNVQSYAEGDNRDMDHMREVLESANKSIAAAYVAKSGMQEQDALDMMARETWLTAERAVEIGLIDKVMFSDSIPSLAAAHGSGLLPRAVIDQTKSMLNDKKNKDLQAAKAWYDFLNLEVPK